jgi:hypothetical protein
MAEKNKVFETKVKHSGIFDFRELYSFMYTLFTDMEYSVEEKNYSEKTKGDQKEIEVAWLAKRKVSDYFRFLIKMDIRIIRMTNAEVVKDGIKISTNKGDFEVKFTVFLEKDYENRWENTAFLRFLRGIYDKYIIKSTLEGYEVQVAKEALDISDQVKAFLTLSVAR